MKLIDVKNPNCVYPAMCDHSGCKDIAVCRPVLLIKSRKESPEGAKYEFDLWHANWIGNDNYLVRYVIQIQLCGHHKGQFNLKKYMNEETWSAIENHVRQNQMSPPDKDDWEIEWEESLDECGRKLEVA